MAVDELGRALWKQYERAVDRRSAFDDQWQEVGDHVAGRSDFTTVRRQGEKRNTFIYDTTALHQGGLLAAGIHSLQSNPLTGWYEIVTEDPRLMEDVDVLAWLEDTENVTLNLFRAPARGFNRNAHEAYIDEVWFGNASMFVDDIPGDGPMFAAQALRHNYWLTNEYGAVDTWFRMVPFTARNAKKRFKDKAGKLVDKALKDGKDEQEFMFLHVVKPADDPDPRSLLPKRRMKFHSIYIEKSEKVVVDEGGYEEQPIITPRWEVNAGEDYGCGPGMRALPAAMMLNEMKRTVLEAGQKATNPPMLAGDENILKSPVRAHPNAIITVRADALMMRRPPVELLPIDARGVGIGHQMLQNEQADVKKHFLPELLQLIQNAGATPMTATQVVELSNTYMSIVAPVLGGQQNEFLGPLLNRVFKIASREGLLLPVPTLLKGQALRIEYRSPAARAQKQTEIQAIQQTMLDAQQFAQTTPEVLDNLNPDEALRKLAHFRGVPASVLRSMADVIQRREAEAKLAQEQAMMQQGLAMAEMAQKTGLDQAPPQQAA